jgi:thymidylate synthase ThyX
MKLISKVKNYWDNQPCNLNHSKKKFLSKEYFAERTYDNYETMLNERFDGSTIDENKKGLARELARMNLTLNTYTQWYWKTDLLNLYSKV